MGDANIKVWVPVEDATKDQGGNGHQLLIGVTEQNGEIEAIKPLVERSRISP